MELAAYIDDRLNGFDGPPQVRPTTLDERSFPIRRSPCKMTRHTCVGPASWKDFSLVEKDVANLKAALKGTNVAQAFMTAASPGTVTNHHPNQYYANREQYIEAVAEVMKREYDAIAEAGFVLQLDCPDLALHNTWFPDLSLADFQKEMALNVEAINHATRDIPPEQVRVCVTFSWGAGEGPHNHDPELADIIDVIVKANAQGISVVGANGRHEHEWRVWKGSAPR